MKVNGARFTGLQCMMTKWGTVHWTKMYDDKWGTVHWTTMYECKWSTVYWTTMYDGSSATPHIFTPYLIFIKPSSPNDTPHWLRATQYGTGPLFKL